jgi:hypothetical protein
MMKDIRRVYYNKTFYLFISKFYCNKQFAHTHTHTHTCTDRISTNSLHTHVQTVYSWTLDNVKSWYFLQLFSCRTPTQSAPNSHATGQQPYRRTVTVRVPLTYPPILRKVPAQPLGPVKSHFCYRPKTVLKLFRNAPIFTLHVLRLYCWYNRTLFVTCDWFRSGPEVHQWQIIGNVFEKLNKGFRIICTQNNTGWFNRRELFHLIITKEVLGSSGVLCIIC